MRESLSAMVRRRNQASQHLRRYRRCERIRQIDEGVAKPWHTTQGLRFREQPIPVDLPDRRLENGHRIDDPLEVGAGAGPCSGDAGGEQLVGRTQRRHVEVLGFGVSSSRPKTVAAVPAAGLQLWGEPPVENASATVVGRFALEALRSARPNARTPAGRDKCLRRGGQVLWSNQDGGLDEGSHPEATVVAFDQRGVPEDERRQPSTAQWLEGWT